MTRPEIDKAVTEAVKLHPLHEPYSYGLSGLMLVNGDGQVTRWYAPDDSLVVEVRVVEKRSAKYGRPLLAEGIGWKALHAGLELVIAATSRMEPGATAVVKA